MDQRKPKIIVVSCMHGRNKTVRKCLEKMPFIDKYMTYSTNEDGQFLKGTDVVDSYQFENLPLSKKWNHAIKQLERIDFDGVILLGSDDYIDEKFLSFVCENIQNYDLIGFKDIYFEKGYNQYYWGGYTNHRKGEPAGAGKVYSKEFLQRIKYDLFTGAKNSGLDGVSWRVCTEANAKILTTSLKENDLFLCDIKDGEGLTELRKIPNLTRIK